MRGTGTLSKWVTYASHTVARYWSKVSFHSRSLTSLVSTYFGFFERNMLWYASTGLRTSMRTTSAVSRNTGPAYSEGSFDLISTGSLFLPMRISLHFSMSSVAGSMVSFSAFSATPPHRGVNAPVRELSCSPTPTLADSVTLFVHASHNLRRCSWPDLGKVGKYTRRNSRFFGTIAWGSARAISLWGRLSGVIPLTTLSITNRTASGPESCVGLFEGLPAILTAIFASICACAAGSAAI
mmetsp:Transcript_12351/g.25943  ORF Transcript_12351/g.25943 Transcript_12351/m.25943 type:complete len:239 (-) Transcript_12351:476-1192(-)